MVFVMAKNVVVELKIERWEKRHGDLKSFCEMKDYEEMRLLKA